MSDARITYIYIKINLTDYLLPLLLLFIFFVNDNYE